MIKLAKIKTFIKYCCCRTLGEILFHKLEDEVRRAEVISFDLFDTLVKRDVKEPKDVHFLVGRKFFEKTGRTIEKYEQCRAHAEYAALKNAIRNEITLRDIFSQMPNIPEKDRELLFRLEKEIEYEVCCQNQELKKVYDMADSLGKHIVITSDMYLPEDLIQEILRKCGYKGYEKIYLSSSYGVTKSSGKLFQYLKRDYEVVSDRILHIGDNVKSDFYRARQSGIKACLIHQERKNVYYYKKSEMRLLEEKNFYTFLNNHKLLDDDINELEENSSVFARTIGYEIIGPILWGYTQWIQEKLKADRIEKIFFLSREGALLQKAYQIIFPDSTVTQRYLYVSRQALQVPLLSECHNYCEMIQAMKPMMRSHTLDNIGRECAFDNRYWEECNKLNLDVQSSIFDIPLEKQKSYYDLIDHLGKENFWEQKDLVREYLKQEGFESKIAIADIGWQGTMQRTLSSYCDNADITGYYLGVRNVRAVQYYEGLARKGYLFEPGRHEEWDSKMRFATEILETLFLNGDGSVTGYCKKDSRVEPCLGKNEYGWNTDMFLKEVQKAALRFLEDWKNSVLSDYELTRKMIMKGYEHFAVKLTMKTVNCFEDFCYLDGGIEKSLLPDKSMAYYIRYPRKLLSDMDGSACKIFALKKILKLPLPYFHLLKFLLFGLKIKSPCAKNMEQ